MPRYERALRPLSLPDRPATTLALLGGTAFAVYAVVTPTNVLLIPYLWGVLHGVAYFLDRYLFPYLARLVRGADGTSGEDRGSVLAPLEEALLVVLAGGTVIPILVAVVLPVTAFVIVVAATVGSAALVLVAVCWRR